MYKHPLICNCLTAKNLTAHKLIPFLPRSTFARHFSWHVPIFKKIENCIETIAVLHVKQYTQIPCVLCWVSLNATFSKTII